MFKSGILVLLFLFSLNMGYAEDYESMLIKANAYFKAGQLDAAKDIYGKLLQFEVMDSISKVAYKNLASIYSLQGQNKKARLMYENALKLAPADGDIYFNLANIDMKMNDYAAAVKHYRAAIKFGKSGTDVFVYLIEAYYAQNDLKSARKIITAKDAGLRSRDDYNYIKALVLSKGGKKDKDRAITIFEKLLYTAKHEDIKYKSYFKMSELLYKTGNIDKAIMILKQGLRYYPSDANLYLTLGGIYEDRGMTYEAIKSLQKAYALNPGDTQILFGLGRNALKTESLFPKALWAFKKIIDLYPENTQALFFYATALQMHGDMTKAVQYYQKVIALDPLSGYAKDSFLNLGNIYDDAGDYASALTFYQSAFRLDPSNSDLYYNLGLVYYHMKDYDNAVANYKKAIKLNPNKAQYWTNLGNAYVRKNMLYEAEQAYKKAQDINPSMEDIYNLGKIKTLE